MAKPYHHGDLHEQLLNAGEAALGEMPVEKVTLREIARRAGVSHAAPKHHFHSLGHLLAEIAARGYRRFIVALKDGADSAANQTPEDRLLGMGRAYVQFAGENAAAYSLMFGQREPVVMTPNLIDASYEAWSEMETAVSSVTGSNGASAGALHLWSSIHGLSMLLLARRLPPDVAIHNVREHQLRMIVQGLKSE